jgi:endo-1,3-1,4-beta-glycanase ExoK
VPVSSKATFTETFSEGALNTNVWIASDWVSDNYAAAGSNVTWTPNNASLSQGMLQLTLEQPTAGTSTCAELQSKETFGYGTFEFVMRMSSTSPTPNGSGSVESGSDSAAFLFINNSQTELDIEFCGNTPGNINLTNWDTLSAHQTTSPSVANLAAGFHTYQLIWTPGQVQWTIDGVVVATHTADIPSTPAYIMLNFWGTNSANWGGMATPGVTRYMYVSSVSFTPYEA